MSSPNPASNQPASKDLLASFRQAYKNLEILPLLKQEDLDNFRVNYGTEALEKLEQQVEDSPSGNSKIVFAGHRGCGKSTLLAAFSRQMRDRYFVVFFSISDMIEMSDVNHINILFAIAVRLMQEAERQEIKIKESAKNSFYEWFATRTQIKTQDLVTEGSIGFKLFELIAGKLKAESKTRDEIKQEFSRNISELVGKINEIALIIQNAIELEILVVIDDLDKLDLTVAREVYHNNIKALFQPNFRIILTVPIAALREVSLAASIETEANNRVIQMPVSKLFRKGERRQPNAKPLSEAFTTLKDVLSHRIPSQLIEQNAAEQIILYSGGVLREVIRIANECCRICLILVRRNPQNIDLKINDAVIKEAFDNLRIDFDSRIGKADYVTLETTYKDFKPDDPSGQRFLDLLHGLYILEYRNSQLWYDVHPIVTELITKNGE
jgi:energy-coupling factor transporter ATP-binding protein EcfA2